MSDNEVKVELKGVINPKNLLISISINFIALICIGLMFKAVDSLAIPEYNILTKVAVAFIIGTIKGFIDDVLNLNNDLMSTSIRDSIKNAIRPLESHFANKQDLVEGSKDGCVIIIQRDIAILKSHFEEGGVIKIIQGDVAELKSDVAELKTNVGTILQILRENEGYSNSNKKREKTGR